MFARVFIECYTFTVTVIHIYMYIFYIFYWETICEPFRHDELLQLNGSYADMWHQQLTKKEEGTDDKNDVLNSGSINQDGDATWFNLIHVYNIKFFIENTCKWLFYVDIYTLDLYEMYTQIKRGDLVHLQQFYLWEMLVYLHVYVCQFYWKGIFPIFTLIAGWSSISTTCQMSSE